jgi:hypothetical protein
LSLEDKSMPRHFSDGCRAFRYDPDTGVVWRTLHFLGHPGHKVGTDGSVWTRWRKVGNKNYPTYVLGTVWHELRPCRRYGGYPCVKLSDPGRCRTVYPIHRLVLDAFAGPYPPGWQCRHLDGSRTNNDLANLCWGTPAENYADSVRHGTARRGQCGHAKLSEEDVLMIHALHERGQKHREIAARFDVSVATVSAVVRGERWRALWLWWRSR